MSSIKRKSLFRGGRPQVRPFKPEQDMWVLWAAYDTGSFPNMKQGMTRQEFETHVNLLRASHTAMDVIEDNCRWFKEKRGPIALVTIDNLGWRMEPYCDFFRWATPRMKLRATVSFLHLVRCSQNFQFTFWHSMGKFEKFYDKMRDYGIPVGKVPIGDGNFMFYMRGRKRE